MKVLVRDGSTTREIEVADSAGAAGLRSGEYLPSGGETYRLYNPHSSERRPVSGAEAATLLQNDWQLETPEASAELNQGEANRGRRQYAEDMGGLGALSEAGVDTITGGLATRAARSIGRQAQLAEIARGSNAQVPDYGTASREAYPVEHLVGQGGALAGIGVAASLTGGAAAEAMLPAAAEAGIFSSMPALMTGAARAGIPLALESGLQGLSEASNEATLRNENLTGEAVVADSIMALGINATAGLVLHGGGMAARAGARALFGEAGEEAAQVARGGLRVIDSPEGGLPSIHVPQDQAEGAAGLLRRGLQASPEQGMAAEQLARHPELRAALDLPESAVASQADRFAQSLERGVLPLERESAQVLRSAESRAAINRIAGEASIEQVAPAISRFAAAANNMQGIISSLSTEAIPARFNPVLNLNKSLQEALGASGGQMEFSTERLFQRLTDLHDGPAFANAADALEKAGMHSQAEEVARLHTSLRAAVEDTSAWGDAANIRAHIGDMVPAETRLGRLLRRLEEPRLEGPGGQVSNQVTGNKIVDYANRMAKSDGLPAQSQREAIDDLLKEVSNEASIHERLGNSEYAGRIREAVSETQRAHAEIETRAIARSLDRTARNVAGGELKAHVINTAGGALGSAIGGVIGGWPGRVAGGWLGHRAGAVAQRNLVNILSLANKTGSFDRAYVAALAPVKEVLTGGNLQVLRPGVSGAAQAFKSYKDQQAEYNRVSSEIRALVASPDNFTERTGKVLSNVAMAHPGVGQAAANAMARGYQYLWETLPPPSVDAFTGQVRPQTKATMDQFFSKLSVVTNPLSILDSLAAGRLSSSQVECLRVVYPSIYGSMARDIGAMVGPEVPYQMRVQLSTLFNSPLDPTTDPMFMNTMHNTYAQTSAQAGAIGMSRQQANGAGAQPARSTRRLSVSAHTQSESDAVNNGELA